MPRDAAASCLLHWLGSVTADWPPALDDVGETADGGVCRPPDSGGETPDFGGVPVRHGAAWRFCRPLARRGRRGSSRAVPGESRAAGRMFPVKRRYSGRRKEVAVPSSGPETASRSSVVVLVMRSRLVHRPLVAPCTGCTAMVGARPLPAGDEGDRTTQVPRGTAAHDRSGETRAGCRRRASTKIPALYGGEPRVRSGRGIGSG